MLYIRAVRHANKRFLALLLIGFIAASLLVFVAAKVSAHISRRRAEHLLHDLRELQVGKSTFENARVLIERHGGGDLPPENCTNENESSPRV